MDITGAVALVTGGSGGLGARICERLAAEGVTVAVGYHLGEERAAAVAARIEAAGGSARSVAIDQADPASIEAAVSAAAGTRGALDIVVNNAGIATGGQSVAPGDLDAFTPDIWDELMTVNVRGPYLVARAAAAYLRTSGRGSIVNIGSTLGHGDWYQDRIFAPSKAAVVPLTRFLAAALAPEVRVNCVAPGLMVETGLGGGGPTAGGNNAAYEAWQGRAALGAFTDVDDVAAHVVQLCKSRSITGQSIGVDAGIHFH
ncbi:MAG: SDR family NAD(P)-dependent oxidoreductase [Pseudomonadota bacterium]